MSFESEDVERELQRVPVSKELCAFTAVPTLVEQIQLVTWIAGDPKSP